MQLIRVGIQCVEIRTIAIWDIRQMVRAYRWRSALNRHRGSCLMKRKGRGESKWQRLQKCGTWMKMNAPS